MITILRTSKDQYSRLKRHLLKGKTEQAAFLFCKWEEKADSITLVVQDIFPIQKKGFSYRSKYHISLADNIRPHIIKRAWDSKCTIVEAHSHRDSKWPAQFSPSDLHGFKEFVPHVRWRLRYPPYVALVFTDNNFDALVWSGNPGALHDLTMLEIETEKIYPTNKTLIQSEDDYDYFNVRSI
jgi:hypothetical protein